MDNKTEFSTCVHTITARRQVVERMLIEVQLREFPDSHILPVSEALDWAYDTPDISAELVFWEKLHVGLPPQDFRRERMLFAEQARTSKQLRAARALALALQYPAGVFYVCGRKSDGTHHYRGFRYGLQGSEYLSGFGKD